MGCRKAWIDGCAGGLNVFAFFDILLREHEQNWLMLSAIQVEPQEKKKTPKGRAKKRLTYTRRFVNVTMTGGKRKVSGLNYIASH